MPSRRGGSAAALIRLGSALTTGALASLRRGPERTQRLIPITLSLVHDDGVRSRHLGVTVKLPAVPRAGERVRAGSVGSFLTVNQVLWNERDVMTVLDPVSATDQKLTELLNGGWRVLSEWPSIPTVAPPADGRFARVQRPRSASGHI